MVDGQWKVVLSMHAHWTMAHAFSLYDLRRVDVVAFWLWRTGFLRICLLCAVYFKHCWPVFTHHNIWTQDTPPGLVSSFFFFAGYRLCSLSIRQTRRWIVTAMFLNCLLLSLSLFGWGACACVRYIYLFSSHWRNTLYKHVRFIVVIWFMRKFGCVAACIQSTRIDVIGNWLVVCII